MGDVAAGRKKILVVDDEKNFLKIAGIRLELSGYDVVKLDGGERVLEVAKAEKPDLILLDIVMPGKNGCDVCKELKAEATTRKIPVIMFTAHYPEEEYLKRSFRDAGADDYMLKPFEARELLDKIDALIKK